MQPSLLRPVKYHRLLKGLHAFIRPYGLMEKGGHVDVKISALHFC